MIFLVSLIYFTIIAATCAAIYHGFELTMKELFWSLVLVVACLPVFYYTLLYYMEGW